MKNSHRPNLDMVRVQLEAGRVEEAVETMFRVPGQKMRHYSQVRKGLPADTAGRFKSLFHLKREARAARNRRKSANRRAREKAEFELELQRRDAPFDSLTRQEMKEALIAIREGDKFNAACCAVYGVAWRVFKDSGCDPVARDRAFAAAVKAVRQRKGKDEIYRAGWLSTVEGAQ